MTTYTWSPWDGGGLPPWMDIQDQPWFDECHAADRLQDLQWAAQATAERFGPLAELADESTRTPRPRWLPPADRPVELPTLDPAAIRAIVWRIDVRRAPVLPDDEFTCARRRRILTRAFEPDTLPARDRGARTA